MVVKMEELPVDEKIVKYCKEILKFDEFTPVQKASINYFFRNYDCIVQAPTGSGKTLAYGLPMIQILDAKKQEVSENAFHILGLILAPSKELVSQVAGVLKPIAALFNINVVKLVGGGGKKNTVDKQFKGNCIFVGTPGRTVHVISGSVNVKKAFRSLEMLIIDEADRFSDEEFKVSVSNILSHVPKQRTTGLFSATQAKEMEGFLKFGLRNPVRIAFAGGDAPLITEDITEAAATGGEATPAELENFYTINDAEQKLLALIEFLNTNAQAKVLIFMSNLFEVEYFSQILPHFLTATKRPLLAVHRKKNAKREQIIKSFANAKKAILLSTDLMARGLDITDIDWVVQFDIPKQTSWFIHRSGRTARQGRKGKAVVFLNKEEEAYVDFLSKYEQVQLQPHTIKNLTKEKAHEVREKVRELALTDREILLNGTKAFVSFVEFYIKHDCKIVCKLSDQDVPGIAHAFGLHRLPVMKEFRGRQDLKLFENSKLDLSKVEFKNEKMEAKRKIELEERKKAIQEKLNKASRKRKSTEKEEAPEKSAAPKKKKNRKQAEWEELQQDQRLLKKYKKGKISKAEINQEL